ncbi:LamG-like jellyroll fold domain-containing protein [Sphaerisporangium sp. NPDC088356]|uniref:LamG-like jellyroll fold domain-containing protein n=1 Tax=Sphaerisporangium sp. NPDC088356 TaxID=3154871 RepID=UPI0034280A1E
MRRSGWSRRLRIATLYLVAPMVLISGIGVPEGLVPAASAGSVGGSDAQLSAADVDRPVQQTGTAAGRPHLVPSDATKADVKPSGEAGADRKPPKGALPMDVRNDLSKEPAKGGLKPPASPYQKARDTRKTAGAAVTVAASCYYPSWSALGRYSAGTIVSYFNATVGMTEAHDFQATRDPQGSPPTGTTAWNDLGPCYVYTPPAPQPPTLEDFWPGDDGLVGSLTPTLGAWATPATGGVSYWFQICSGPSGPSGSWDWCSSSSWTSGGAWIVPAGKLKWGKSYWWMVKAQDTSNGLIATSPWLTLTAEPEQPSINSLLGIGTGGRQFNQVAGNYTQAVTDASVATVGPPLAVTRTYNSLDPRSDGMFGAGWTTRWDMRLVEEPQTQTVLLTYPGGGQARFGAMGDGTYAPPQGTYATLATVTGGGWRLMDKSATSYLFDAQGRVTKVTDNRGRAQDLVYGTDGKLSKVTSTGGRSLNFTWNGGHATGVSTDPVNGAPLSWSYTYDGDKLVKVCGPGSATACSTYAYTDASRYSTSVLNSMPTGYWRLGESNGGQGAKLADAVGWNLGGEDASFSSGGYDATVGVAGALGGSSDTAVRFAGTSSSSSFARLPNAAISGRGTSLTVEAWFKTTGSGVVLGHSDSSSSTPTNFTPAVYVGTDGKLRGQFWNGSANPITSAGAVNNGQWHHVALSGDGSSQTLYLDGQAVGTRNGTIDHRDQFSTRLGSGYASGSWPASVSSMQMFPFKGDIDEVAIYGRSLAAAEIRAHFEAGTAGPQMTKAILPSGRVLAQNAYAADSGRLQTHADVNGGLWKLSALQYSKDPKGDPQATITVTDPHNGPLTSVHDALRGLRATSETDQLTKKTTYEYDTGGYPAKITDRNGNTVQLTHDERGNELSVTKCRSAGNCQTSYISYYLNTSDKFDPRNDQMTAYRDERSTSSTSNTYATKWEYTAFGEQAKQTTPATTDFPNGRSTAYAYTDGTETAVGGGQTPAGLLKTKTDPKGNQRIYAYTAAGDLAQVTEPTGLVTEHTYDAIGRKTSSSQIFAGQAGEEPPPAGANGLVAAYGFDAGTGTAIADDSGHSQAGVATGTSWSASGKYGKALSFDGASSLVTVPDSPSLRLSQGMTLMAWVKPAALDNWRQVLMKEFTGGMSYGLYASDGSQPNGWAVNTDGTEGNVYPPRGLPLNTWSHIAVTYDGAKLQFYVDGTMTAERDFSGSLRADGGPLRIGGNSVWGEHFSGLIDEVRVYNRALPETEIQSDKDTPVAGSGQQSAPSTTSTTSTTTMTSFAYDSFGRLAMATGTGVKNQVSGVTHTAEARYTYDDDSNKLTETLADLTGGDPARTTTYEYDTYGRVEKVTGPEGGAKLTAYDHMGRVVSTTDAAGATYNYGYTSRGEPATTTLKGWTGSPTSPEPARDVVMQSKTYDPGGRLYSQTDAMGRTTRYTYFGDDRLAEEIADKVKLNASTTAVDVVLTSSTYDAAGNLTRQVAGGGKTRVDYVYDAAGGMTSSTLDPTGLGRKTAYVYDANTNVTQETLSGTGTTRTEAKSYRYDAGDRLIEQTVENGATDLTTSWTVDDRGLVTEITDPRGHAPGATRMDYTSLISYDALGRPIKTQGPPVKIELGGAAAVNERPTVQMGYNTAGQETHKTAPDNRTTLTTYDKAGRVTSVTGTPYTPPGGTSVTPLTSFGYDAAGRVTSVTDPRGNTSNSTYDVLGRTVRITDPPATQGATRGVSDYTYTLTGERLSATDPTGARAEATYDGMGRQVTSTRIERKPTAAALTTTSEYDTAGNLVAVKRPAGNRSQMTVNAAGEIEAETDALGKSTTFAYDPAGRMTKATDALGNATSAEYDLAGRKIAAKDLNPSGTVLRTYGFDYDAADNAIAETSPEGHVIRRSFDAADRVTQLVEPVSASKTITTSFGYDAAGQRTRTTDGRGNAFIATYNSLGLVESRIDPATQAHPNLPDRTWTAAYDASGNLVSVLQPGGVRITSTYDNLNRLVNETGSGAEAATQSNTFGYDLAGRRTSAGDLNFTFNDRGLLLKTAATGSSSDLSSFGYDANDRLAQRTDASGSATFTWDNADRLKTFSDPVTATTLTYGYDNADKLTNIDYGTSGPKRTYSYDPMDRLTGDTLKTSAGAAIASITYGYDRDDNLTTKTTAGTAGAGTNTYAYDHSNRLTSWTAPGGAVTNYAWDDSGNRIQAGTKTFTYDERNRLLSGDGTTYTYTARGTTATETKGNVTKVLQFDAFDRMTSDGDAGYTYDALGRLASRTQGATVGRYLYGDFGNDVVARTDGAGAEQATYSRGVGGEPIGISDGSGARFAFADQHGDVVGTFGATATSLADSIAYSPFGEETARTGAKHELGYQGELTDPTTGKVNMHARWYQPGTGTFASRDSATLNADPSVQGNRYTYANAAPLTNSDPTGHSSLAIYCSNCPVPVVENMPGYMCQNGICVRPDATERWWNDYINSPGFEYYNNPLLSDEEIKRLGDKYMPNGRPVEKGVPFWDMSPEAQELYMQNYSSLLTHEELLRNAALSMMSAGDIKGLDALANGLPSGGNGKKPTGTELYNALKKNQKLINLLTECHSHLDSATCRGLIQTAWNNLRATLCGATGSVPGSQPCNTNPAAKMALGLLGIPVELFEFLATTNPYMSREKFNAAVIQWAQKHGARCEPDAATGLTVCGGLKKGFHYPRGGITIGGVTLTGPRRDKLSPEFRKHEAEHMRQFNWYYNKTGFWPTFLVYYLLTQPPGDPCDNVYERQAEREGDTGYGC